METMATRAAPGDIRTVAATIAARYVQAPARETEAAIAVLALWTLDAVEAGRMTREEATDVFTTLDVSIGDERSGPDLSEQAHELLLEGGWFHDEAIGRGPDPAYFRQLAFAILRQDAVEVVA